ncbi:MAG TPA: PIG-L family deacetylase [Stellaceae bacterium]|jgi:LmbE family N-acetylglucosaminyl deacetylase|nr:PIG-L family deacetylase [Stellaceae bacterium]
MARILLLVPHPDDEIVGAAAMIARHRAAGDRFFGLYLTSGIPAAEQLWRWHRGGRAARVQRRRDEARAAAAILGIEPVGFSDWPSRTLKSHLAAAVAWIDRLLAEHAIDTIWVAAWEGGHQDHDAANFLAAQTAGDRPVREFAEYNSGGGTAKWNRFAAANGSETVLTLTPEELHAKRSLLAIYRSEKDNLAGVRVGVESHRPLPHHDYRRPPHDGKLWREAYHWVGRLMRHPRVDFEPSRDIYATLRGFLNTRLSAAE